MVISSSLPGSVVQTRIISRPSVTNPNLPGQVSPSFGSDSHSGSVSEAVYSETYPLSSASHPATVLAVLQLMKKIYDGLPTSLDSKLSDPPHVPFTVSFLTVSN